VEEECNELGEYAEQPNLKLSPKKAKKKEMDDGKTWQWCSGSPCRSQNEAV
jgi:hypothetical protein